MYGDKKILAIILARGESTEVPNKNLRHFINKGVKQTLLAHTIHTAKQSKYLDSFYVFSEDQDAIEEAINNGAEVPVAAPQEFTRDDTSSAQAITYLLNNLPNNGNDFDYFILLQVTSPLREATDIDTCLEFYLNHEFKDGIQTACVSVSKVPVSPYWMYEQTEDHALAPAMTKSVASLRRQDLPQYNNLNGAIYIARPAWYIQHQSFLTDDSIFYEMPANKALDIKTELDLQILELLLTNAAAKERINALFVKQIAEHQIQVFLTTVEEKSADALAANKLFVSINMAMADAANNLTATRKIIIDFILDPNNASEHRTLSVFNRTIQANRSSLRGMFIDTFLGPVLGEKKHCQFLQSRATTESFFDKALLILAQTKNLVTAANDTIMLSASRKLI
jgi:CMP-N,N'-diacetyllegionaminic acid synthase